MNLKQSVVIFLPVMIMLAFFSCKKGADDPREASERLLAPDKWYISEIYVNDALTFSDGEMKPQFGGIDFERYMENVKFDKAGIVTGYFKGDSKPMTLRWRINSPDILVSAVDTSSKGGDWNIAPQDVEENSFLMKTQTTAYDYPRTTKIALKFKTEK